MSLANARVPAASPCVSDDYGDIVNYIGKVNATPIWEPNIPLMTTGLTRSLMYYCVNFPIFSFLSHSSSLCRIILPQNEITITVKLSKILSRGYFGICHGRDTLVAGCFSSIKSRRPRSGTRNLRIRLRRVHFRCRRKACRLRPSRGRKITSDIYTHPKNVTLNLYDFAHGEMRESRTRPWRDFIELHKLMA